MQAQPICCPTCYSALDWEEQPVQSNCPMCGCPFTIHDGIIDFTPDDRFYWGEIPRETMVRVNERAEQIGWFQSILENVIGKSTRDLSGYLFDPRRIAGLFHYYDPDHNESCLDLGSGWGTLSFGLRHYYHQVYSMDGVLERLQFQTIRLKQEEIENIRIIKGSMLKLPFHDNSMDVVIVNGLLEWIGLSDDVTPPRTLQTRFLQEVKRVLKPSGHIFIGIENRFGADQFLGTIDHSGVRYTSLLPRSVANWVVRHAKRGKKASVISGAQTNCYRTWTYSSWGYRQLLTEVGFTQAEIFWTWPSYNYPHASGTLDSHSMKAYLQTAEKEFPEGVRRMLIKAVQYVPNWLLKKAVQTFSPYFLILASKENPGFGFHERILESDARRSFFRITPNASPVLRSSFLCTNRTGIHKIAGVTFRSNHQGLDISIKKYIDVKGRPIQIDSASQVAAVAEWLVNFQQLGQKGYWDLAELEAEMTSLIKGAAKLIRQPELRASLEPYKQLYLDHAARTALPIVAEHGNLTANNVLITSTGEVEVVGWDHFTSTSNPLMDVGSFFLSLLSDPTGRNLNRHRYRKKDPVAEFSRIYRESMDLPIDLSLVYFVLRGLKRDIGTSAVIPENFLLIRSRIRLLKSSLDYALQTSD